MSRPSKDDYYLNIAREVASRSTCLRRHYGAVIVSNDMIISTGYNGSPRGEINCCDLGECQRNKLNMAKGSGYEHCPAVHAEMNSIISADRTKMIGSTIYIVGIEVQAEPTRYVSGPLPVHYETVEDYIRKYGFTVHYADPHPCTLCRRMIVNAGISRCVGRAQDGSILEIDLQNM